MGKHPLKAKMFEAIQLRLEGLTNAQVSERIGVPRRTLNDWWRREDVLDEYQKELRKEIHVMFNQAIKGTARDLNDGNPWIRQNAQRMIIDRFGSSVMGDDKQEISIHITGGMPDVGMPDPANDD